ncbi:MAG: type II toxin-antitoxin system HicB family antitoxin [Planctomycetaceae bacterium]|nr:type II toxin-antitoxin system HicB family antitoxin [Planctomycetaceae bacterium]
MKQYTVIYERGPRNWSAYVPDLPGCIATAKTRAKLEQQIREAIEFHIEGLRQHGEAVPEPSTEAGAVKVSR